MRAISSSVLAVFVSATVLTAQVATTSSDLAFEAASVKAASANAPRGIVLSGGRLTATDTVQNLARVAFGLTSPEQIVALPVWATTELFTIVAVAPSGTPDSPRPLLAMLRTLLRNRFALASHTEARDAPIYVLSLARADGTLGAGLRPSDFDCGEFVVGIGGETNVRGPCPIMARESRTPGLAASSLKGRSMDKLAGDLRFLTDRPVRNETSLQGLFDVDLEFSRGAPTDSDFISIFTAVREQLGLKLEPGHGPQDVLVIDHVQRPTAD